MTDRRSEIPKDFTYREQAIVIHQTARLREDFIAKRRGAGKMSDEDMNLQAYTVAVLYAAARTLKSLSEENKGQKPGRAAQAPPAEEQSGETSPAQVEEIVTAGLRNLPPGDDGF